jgi:hypothetical protein
MSVVSVVYSIDVCVVISKHWQNLQQK